MLSIKEQWKKKTALAIGRLAAERGIAAPDEDAFVVETPPRGDLGDLALPLFCCAKSLKTAPAEIARRAADLLSSGAEARVVANGPYLNIFVDRTAYIRSLHEAILSEGDSYGASDVLSGRKVMIEFSCPNTNKPLHLGHLRNDALGESVARILAKTGAEVLKVNLINDRGVHICKSMLAYERFGGGTTPEQVDVKSDHFVGDFYVKFSKWAAEDAQAEEEVRRMLLKWEEGDEDTLALWRLMNGWAIEGIRSTYERTGVSFDRCYYESETYRHGREQVLSGLERGIFYREADGSVWVDLADIRLDKKVLLRNDGTSLYLTQDIGTAIARHADWPFDRLIYVVASEQRYHFQVLFHVLAKLGYEWAANLHHLSYGMVNLPEGKMKSREGTVVDADDLLGELSAMAEKEIRAKEREGEVGEVRDVAEKIALGAIHYFLLQPTPSKDMIFNPAESLSFTGNTGPYLQYMGARISSMLRKYRGGQCAFRAELLTLADEWELAKQIGGLPETVADAARDYNPSLVANYLYELCKTFSRYYHDTPILHNHDPELVEARVQLSRMVLTTLRNGLHLLNIPFLEAM